MNDSEPPKHYYFLFFCLFLFFCFFLVLCFFLFFVLFFRCVSAGVPGRHELAGREAVEAAGGTAGIVRCADVCARDAAKP